MVVRGRLAGRGRRWRTPPAAERQLLAALILQALLDAQAGNSEARYWMDYYAPDIAYLWLGIDPECMARWREIPPIDPAEVTFQ